MEIAEATSAKHFLLDSLIYSCGHKIRVPKLWESGLELEDRYAKQRMTKRSLIHWMDASILLLTVKDHRNHISAAYLSMSMASVSESGKRSTLAQKKKHSRPLFMKPTFWWSSHNFEESIPHARNSWQGKQWREESSWAFKITNRKWKCERKRVEVAELHGMYRHYSFAKVSPQLFLSHPINLCSQRSFIFAFFYLSRYFPLSS